MFTKRLMQAGALLLIASAFAGCDNQILDDNLAFEKYTQSFVKKFGLIDPDQDWNLAQSTTVAIDAGEGLHTVKVYAKIAEKYYKVADLTDASGKLNVPIDIPESCKELKVKIDGKSYLTSINGTKSRGAKEGGTIGDITINVSESGWSYFNAQQITPLTDPSEWESYWSVSGESWRNNDPDNPKTGIIPEIGIENQPIGNTANIGIIQDFDVGIKGKVNITPMYWQTSNVHTIGIYMLDNQGRPVLEDEYEYNAEGKAVHKLYGYDVNIKDVIAKVPVYVSKGSGDMQVFEKYVMFDKSRTALEKDVNSTSSDVTVNLWLNGTLGYTEADVISTVWDTDNPSVIEIASSTTTSATLHKKALGASKITATVETTKGTYTYYSVVNVNNLGAGTTGSANIDDYAETVESYIWDLPSDFLTHYGYSSNYKYDGSLTSEEAKELLVSRIKEWYEAGKDLVIRDSECTLETLPPHNYYNITSVDTSNLGTMGVIFTRDDAAFSGESSEPSADPQGEARDYSSLKPAALIEDANGEWVTMQFGNETADPYYQQSRYLDVVLDSGDPGHPLVQFKNESYNPGLEILLRSKTITVDMGDYEGRFCMYSTGNFGTVYSQKAYNTTDQNTVGQSFSASYKHPESGRTFFSFEDWLQNGDNDLNDIVCLITNFTTISNQDGQSLDGDISGGSGSGSGSGSGTGDGEGEGTGDGDNQDDEGQDDDEEVLSWLIAAEDLGDFDDFDFNDIVVAMQVVTKNNAEGEYFREVRIQALAAGGILPVWLHYNNGTADYILGPNGAVLTSGIPGEDEAMAYEWHKWFDGATNTAMINTDAGRTVATPRHIVLTSKAAAAADGSIEAALADAIVSDDFRMASYSVDTDKRIQGFYFTVGTYDGVSQLTSVSSTDCRTLAAPDKGDAPQMFLIPDIGTDGNGWKWPKERKHIMDAYTKFQGWVNSAEGNGDWYLSPNASLVTRPVTVKGTNKE